MSNKIQSMLFVGFLGILCLYCEIVTASVQDDITQEEIVGDRYESIKKAVASIINAQQSEVATYYVEYDSTILAGEDISMSPSDLLTFLKTTKDDAILNQESFYDNLLTRLRKMPEVLVDLDHYTGTKKLLSDGINLRMETESPFTSGVAGLDVKDEIFRVTFVSCPEYVSVFEPINKRFYLYNHANYFMKFDSIDDFKMLPRIETFDSKPHIFVDQTVGHATFTNDSVKLQWNTAKHIVEEFSVKNDIGEYAVFVIQADPFYVDEDVFPKTIVLGTAQGGKMTLLDIRHIKDIQINPAIDASKFKIAFDGKEEIIVFDHRKNFDAPDQYEISYPTDDFVAEIERIHNGHLPPKSRFYYYWYLGTGIVLISICILCHFKNKFGKGEKNANEEATESGI